MFFQPIPDAAATLPPPPGIFQEVKLVPSPLASFIGREVAVFAGGGFSASGSSVRKQPNGTKHRERVPVGRIR